MTELFPESTVASLSPREAWLRAHGLALRKLESGKWECVFDEHNRATGSTAERAAAKYCAQHRIALPAFLTPP